MGIQCEKIKTCLNKNNSKRTYQLLKDLISEKQGGSSTIQDRSGKCLIEDQEIHSRWIEYCSELYTTMRVVTMQSCTAINARRRSTTSLSCSWEVEIEVASLKGGGGEKSARVE